MTLRRWMTTALAATLAISATAALAQERDFGPRGDHRGGPPRNEWRGPPPRHMAPPPPPPRHLGYRPPPPRYAPPPPRYIPPPPPRVVYGYPGARAGFYAGARMPYDYRSRYYVVDRWRDYPRLSPPPRGYQWIQSGADFALVAIATGVIASVILGGN